MTSYHILWIMAFDVIPITIETDKSSSTEDISCSSAHQECVAHVKAMLTWYAAGRLQLFEELIVSLDGVTVCYSLVSTLSSGFLIVFTHLLIQSFLHCFPSIHIYTPSSLITSTELISISFVLMTSIQLLFLPCTMPDNQPRKRVSI